MNAFLYAGEPCAWAQTLKAGPWPLLPLGNRPLIEYGLELCSGLGAEKIVIADPSGAEALQAFIGDGSKWGLDISVEPMPDPETLYECARRATGERGGAFLFFNGPVFLRRTASFSAEKLNALKQANDPLVFSEAGRLRFFLGPAASFETCFKAAAPSTARIDPAAVGLEPVLIDRITTYYALNMQMVRGESERYLTPGYFGKDGSYVGYNTVIRPSVELHPPLSIGSHCRIDPVCEVGPAAVIGDHVIIDRHCEVADCLILPHTYIGHNLEIREKIVSGSRLIDPQDESYLDIAEPWLIAGTELPLRPVDFVRAVAGWLTALLMVCLLLIPFAVVMPLGRLRGSGRFKKQTCFGGGCRLIEVPVFHPTTRGGLMLRLIHGLSLDRFPQLLLVLRGRLWLSGQPLLRTPADDPLSRELKTLFPGVYSYLDTQAVPDRSVAAHDYTRRRSLVEDLRMLRDALGHKFLEIFAPVRGD